eukprot:Rmarinus@m.16813
MGLESWVLRHLPEPQDGVGSLVHFSVSGTPFIIPRESLLNFPDTPLVEIAVQHENCEIFIDRDPYVFHSVMGFYRTGRLHRPQSVCHLSFVEELLDYRLPINIEEQCHCLVTGITPGIPEIPKRPTLSQAVAAITHRQKQKTAFQKAQRQAGMKKKGSFVLDAEEGRPSGYARRKSSVSDSNLIRRRMKDARSGSEDDVSAASMSASASVSEADASGYLTIPDRRPSNSTQPMPYAPSNPPSPGPPYLEQTLPPVQPPHRSVLVEPDSPTSPGDAGRLSPLDRQSPDIPNIPSSSTPEPPLEGGSAEILERSGSDCFIAPAIRPEDVPPITREDVAGNTTVLSDLGGGSDIDAGPDASTSPEPDEHERTRLHYVRERVWELFEDPSSSSLAHFFMVLSVSLILLSVVAFCIETLPEYENESPKAFEAIEMVCVFWFTIEFVCRLFATDDLKAFCRDVLNYIDFLAIFPFYLTLIFAKGERDTFYALRLLRLVRVLRVFKLSRHSAGLKVIAITLKNSSRELGLLMFLMLIGIVLFSSAVYYAEREAEDTPFKSIPHSFWWACVTMTTLGYGDMVPSTLLGKLIGGLCSVMGLLVIALPVSIIGSNFEETFTKYQLETNPVHNSGYLQGLERMSSHVKNLMPARRPLKSTRAWEHVRHALQPISRRASISSKDRESPSPPEVSNQD